MKRVDRTNTLLSLANLFCPWLQMTHSSSLLVCASGRPREPPFSLCAHLPALGRCSGTLFPILLIQGDWSVDQGADLSLFPLLLEIQGVQQEMNSCRPQRFTAYL